MEIDYEERKREMRRLRHVEGWSNTRIGLKYGISRERVRQIIGNTGRDFRRNWTQRILESGRYALELYHHDKIEELPGIKKVWIENWGNYRHDAKGGHVREGQEFEERAYLLLRDHGILGTLMPNRCLYSIETENGIKIDVHGGTTDYSQYSSQNSPYTAYRIPNVRPKAGFDFLMAFIPDGDDWTYFVIPAFEIAHLSGKDRQRAAIRIPYPQMGRKMSKWHKYHQRIDLIQEAEHGAAIC